MLSNYNFKCSKAQSRENSSFFKKPNISKIESSRKKKSTRNLFSTTKRWNPKFKRNWNNLNLLLISSKENSSRSSRFITMSKFLRTMRTFCTDTNQTSKWLSHWSTYQKNPLPANTPANKQNSSFLKLSTK
jgi:hypothetical protein